MRRLVPYLLVLVAVVASIGGLAVRPAGVTTPPTVDYVVVAGAAGLRWDDLDPRRTPALWRQAEQGSIGWLSVRSAMRVTCPSDGWLTLGAGNYAAWPRTASPDGCGPVAPALTRPDGIGANLPDQRTVVRDNADRFPYGTVPGSLSEALRCTTAVGPGAAVAAARPLGRVDTYQPSLPDDPRGLLSQCVLSFVDLGTVRGTGAQRQAQVAQADAALARVVAARPARSLMIVAGVGDTDRSSRLHLAIAEGEGWNGGWLTSAGTGRDGYLQLVDLAPTVLSALGREVPQDLMAGRSATVAPGRPSSVEEAVRGDADADRRARTQFGVAEKFFTVLAIVEILLFLLVIPVMVRARRHAGPRGPALPAARLVDAAEMALTAAALALPAALLADATPWWRADHPAWVFGLVTAALTAVGTVALRMSPRWRNNLWPMGLAAVFGVLVVGADLLTGAQLQLNGVAGYSAIQGARYAGVGGVGLGLFAASLLVVAACLAQRIPRGWRPVLVVLVGGLGVIMVGSPYLGADPIGGVALTAGVCVAATLATGRWVNVPRAVAAGLAWVAVTAGFAVLDLRRPPLEQVGLGRFVTDLANGTAGPALQRAATANGQALVESPLTVLAVSGVLMLAFCQFSPWGGLRRLFGLRPALRAAAAGVTVATLVAGVLGGTALTVAGAAAAAMAPVAVLTTLRVLLRAADRTRPDGETDGPGGPLLRKSDRRPARARTHPPGAPAPR